MKTITDFKKRLQVGVLLHTVHHQTFDYRDNEGKVHYKDSDLGIRKVSKVMSTQFALDTNGKDSYCNYPTSKEVMNITDNSITIGWLSGNNYTTYEPILTYTFI